MRKLCGRLPNALPPPRIRLVRMLPRRALPVPFCLKSFLVEPSTLERFLVAAVP